MTDSQLYLMVGVPVFAIFADMALRILLFRRIGIRLAILEKRFDTLAGTVIATDK